MPLMRGKLFAGKLFAGRLFGQIAEVIATSVSGVHSRKRRIIRETVEDLEEFIRITEGYFENEPKEKPLKRKAKKHKPETREFTHDNVQKWVDYYSWKVLSLKDSAYAVQIENAIEQYAKMLESILAQQELARLLRIEKRRKDEELILLLLTT